MYFRFTTAIKRRIIEELRRFWSEHPKYQDDLPNHIHGKYAFTEQGQHSIVVLNASGNVVSLSPDNFQGTVKSYVHLARVGQYPGTSIEWVREDSLAIRRNGGTFPSLPGVYYITITGTEDAPTFTVQSLLDVLDEQVTKIDDTTYQLSQIPVDGTLRLYDMPGNTELVENVNYTLDEQTGEITLLTDLNGGILSADFRYRGPTGGPYDIIENFSNVEAVPGVVIVFGRRVQVGDQLGVVVSQYRQLTALEYGGRWNFAVDIEIRSRDDISQSEITDMTAFYLWGLARPRLSDEGIEITNLSIGGESEEPYDEVGDDYWYLGSISLEIEADWLFHVPLTAVVRRVLPQTLANFNETAGLSDEELVAAEQNLIQAVDNLGLRSFDDPFFGTKPTHEGLK